MNLKEGLNVVSYEKSKFIDSFWSSDLEGGQLEKMVVRSKRRFDDPHCLTIMPVDAQREETGDELLFLALSGFTIRLPPPHATWATMSWYITDNLLSTHTDMHLYG